MKLYGKITSERASKGQGGNEYLEIELKVQDRENAIGKILLDYHADSEEKSIEMDEWVLSWQGCRMVDPNIIAQGHVYPKGEKPHDPRTCENSIPCIDCEIAEGRQLPPKDEKEIRNADGQQNRKHKAYLEARETIDKAKGKKQKGEEHYGQHIENGISYCVGCKKYETKGKKQKGEKHCDNPEGCSYCNIEGKPMS